MVKFGLIMGLLISGSAWAGDAYYWPREMGYRQHNDNPVLTGCPEGYADSGGPCLPQAPRHRRCPDDGVRRCTGWE
jgi:hypothetical protein